QQSQQPGESSAQPAQRSQSAQQPGQAQAQQPQSQQQTPERQAQQGQSQQQSSQQQAQQRPGQQQAGQQQASQRQAGQSGQSLQSLTSEHDNLSTFVRALEETGLAESIMGEGQNYTAFAPTDEAFEQHGDMDELMQPENREQLIE